MAETGKTLGLAFHYDRVLVTPNTLNGHRLLWWARETGSQDALAEALFRAYFSEGHDPGNLEVLTDVAAEVGLLREQTRRFLQVGCTSSLAALVIVDGGERSGGRAAFIRGLVATDVSPE